MTQTYIATVTVIECGKCGVAFGMTEDFIRERKRDKRTWYCPNGHPRYYPGPTPEQEQIAAAERAAAAERRARERAEFERDRARTDAHGKAILLGKAKAKLARVEERVAHGVCPCCNRTFKQLAAHMARKHPDYQARKRGARR